MNLSKKTNPNKPISRVTISLLSPEDIFKESYGEVRRPETINHRTFKPVEGGLLCERIFGPSEDWKCRCEKYKGIRYKYIKCDECGVEVNEKKVRKERIGHIKLEAPVLHIYFYKQAAYYLGISTKDLESIVSYTAYIVIQEGTNPISIGPKQLQQMNLLTVKEYTNLLENNPGIDSTLNDANKDRTIIGTGAKAIYDLICILDPETRSAQLRKKLTNTNSKQRRLDLLKQLKVVEAFRKSAKTTGNSPKFMVIRILVVVPPGLRVMIFHKGKLMTEDINELYRRIININKRLAKLIELKMPAILIRNESRLLQEAVNALFDNSSKVNTVLSQSGRPLKSLTDNLKGKQGRIRKNLLGKRVDYSGRSVITCGPDLKLDECGLPKEMAIELFKPFVIRQLLDRGVSETVKEAKNLIASRAPVIWDVLQAVVKDRFVLLNRAPTLHAFSMLAFRPKLIQEKAIQLHPLTCPGFNADFDGDQMAVHVPLSQEAMSEASEIMLASKNLLNPIDGTPIVVPSKDMVLGLYYLTKGRKSTATSPVKGEGLKFYGIEEVIIAFNNNKLSRHAHIKLCIEEKQQNSEIPQKKIIDTTVGRALLNHYIPKEIGYVNELLTKKKLQKIILEVYKKTNQKITAKLLDDLKELGFKHCYEGGISISLNDIKTPKAKEMLIKQAEKKVDAIEANYRMGIITYTEHYNKVIDVWTEVGIKVMEEQGRELEEDNQGFNPILMMLQSGARGNEEQVRQLGGMKGLMLKPQRSNSNQTENISKTPIYASFKNGLDKGDYFRSLSGSRKGVTDLALKTADAGFLTRKYTSVAQNIIIKENNCGTQRGLTINAVYDNIGIVKTLFEQIEGRVPVTDIKHPNTNQILAKSDQVITTEKAIQLEKADVKNIRIRTVTTCESKVGICALCYGTDLGKNNLVQKGKAIGITAAQSIGEPGTQLTLKTFHKGGSSLSIAVEDSIKASLEGIVHLEDIKTVPIEKNGKKTNIVLSKSGELQILDPATKKEQISYHIPYGSYLLVEQNQKLQQNQQICYWDSYNSVILAERSGQVTFNNIEEGITYKKEYDEYTGHYEKIIIESKDKTKIPSIILTTKEKTITYNMPVGAFLMIEEQQKVQAGQILVKTPRVVKKMQDITGGLPRVIELFEARKPSNAAVLAPIEGIVTYGKVKRGNREIIITAKDGTQVKTQISSSQHILVQDQEYVKHSAMLSDGTISIADLLQIQGPEAVQKYIIDEIQAVYRTQGVKINSKHIEVIVRQMMQKVEIISSGDTTLMPSELVHKKHFISENENIKHKKIITHADPSSLLKEGQLVTQEEIHTENQRLQNNNQPTLETRPTNLAIAKRKIQGITQAALGSESFLAAAAFQQTPKILTAAAMAGQVDNLQGIQENIIVGNLVPVGTGLTEFQNMLVTHKKEYNNLLKLEKLSN